MTKENVDEKIRSLKDRIADCKDYISSDFCIKCVEIYKEIELLKTELAALENERT
jgi:hypothetical protein